MAQTITCMLRKQTTMITEQVGSIARYRHHLEDRLGDELGVDNYSFTLHSGVIHVAPVCC